MATTDLDLLMGGLDWQYAMEYAKFTFSDVRRVIFAQEGDNDGPDWRLVVKLKDGRFGALTAGCDYSGWDCQASGQSEIFATEREALEFIGETPPPAPENTVVQETPSPEPFDTSSFREPGVLPDYAAIEREAERKKREEELRAEEERKRQADERHLKRQKDLARQAEEEKEAAAALPGRLKKAADYLSEIKYDDILKGLIDRNEVPGQQYIKPDDIINIRCPRCGRWIQTQARTLEAHLHLNGLSRTEFRCAACLVSEGRLRLPAGVAGRSTEKNDTTTAALKVTADGNEVTLTAGGNLSHQKVDPSPETGPHSGWNFIMVDDKVVSMRCIICHNEYTFGLPFPLAEAKQMFNKAFPKCSVQKVL